MKKDCHGTYICCISGETLKAAIESTDLATDAYPLAYQINCAHFDHFSDLLVDSEEAWTRRLRGLRPNASRRSHDELDESPELDSGDPGMGGWKAACSSATKDLD